MPTLKQIKYFRAVAETGKVSEAAQHLNISQSAVTLAVKELESELGVPLVERRQGGMALTINGQRFLGHARGIETAVLDAVRSVKHDRQTVKGTLRLAVSYTVSGYLLFPILARFRRMYPSVEFILTEAARASVEDMVARHTADLGVLLVSNLSDPSAVRIRPVLTSPRQLWLPEGHRLASKTSVELSDVARLPYVYLMADEADRSTQRYWESAGFSPQVIFRTESVEGVRSMVATGAAVTVLSDLVYRPWSLDGGRVERRPLTPEPPPMEVGIIWRRDHDLSDVEERFMEVFSESVHGN